MYKILKSVCGDHSKQEFKWILQEILSRRTTTHSLTGSHSTATAGHSGTMPRALDDTTAPKATIRNVLQMIEELKTMDRHEISQLLTEKELSKLDYWLSSRLSNKPLQYILGNQPFLDSTILLRPPVLIPRWETEEWVLNLIQSIDKSTPIKVLDLCTGTGCIALSIAKMLPLSTVIGIDISPMAIKLSKLNKRKNLKDCSRLQYYLMDVTSPTISELGSFDLVVSNPPYIPPQDQKTMDSSVLDWEDHGALFTPDSKGTFFHSFIAKRKELFKKGSRLVMEIGDGQGSLVEGIFIDCGFGDVNVFRDLAGNERTVSGIYRGD